jgi:hypothetical protein
MDQVPNILKIVLHCAITSLGVTLNKNLKNSVSYLCLTLVLLSSKTSRAENQETDLSIPRIHQRIFGGARPLPMNLRNLFLIKRGESLLYLPKKGTRIELILKRPGTISGSHSLPASSNDKRLSVYEADDLIPVEIKNNPKYEAILHCWHMFASGLPLPETPDPKWCEKSKMAARKDVVKMQGQALDPVSVGRDLTLRYGKVLARDSLFDYVNAYDDSKGNLQYRFHDVISHGGHEIYGDSLLSLDRGERKAVNIVFIPGYGNGGDRYGKMMLNMQERFMGQEGYTTQFAHTQSKQGASVNNGILIKAITKAFAESDKVILVSVSKGSSDLVQALSSDQYLRIPETDRKKLKLIISIAGVCRISHAAWYATASGSPKGKLISFIHWLQMPSNERSLNGLRSLSKDGLAKGADLLKEALPNATWVSGMAFPEGRFAQVEREPLFKKSDKIYPDSKYLTGPDDGVMEIMSGVVPHGSGVPQWLTKVYGSHQTFDGFFREDKTPVSRSFHQGMADEEYLEPGYEILKNYFRAIPKTVLDR